MLIQIKSVTNGYIVETQPVHTEGVFHDVDSVLVAIRTILYTEEKTKNKRKKENE
jgi:hypothetical protein